ncbi:putative sugar O-methyltransferase [Seleniivibrio woodruffii]|uniref:Putative sugar O-methyltransferase n=1 Tax=Seleniivibrio woodruffii TaxID=1078050 RepID=A0A4R1KEH0_9BACT|nr:putative sugar O-methyltransferase [Seleniivibrio woodruffii]TCK61669.1 putative sugar O-methyltransferase [Seleniivibrio woodruffii]TVZ35216.1 putative sugar O-methyltransferase [Seleniivibrio woodruffii]
MDNNYGSVWSNAIRAINDILKKDISDEYRFGEILSTGFFTQLTSYKDPEFNGSLTDWYIDFLKNEYVFSIENLPDASQEASFFPEHLLVRRNGMLLSTDMLRYVAYCLKLKENSTKIGTVLEIGSGYGGFARIMKAFTPDVRICLTDINESLKCAEIYLRKSCPEARISWDIADADADFILIPVENAQRDLSGRQFDLAVNIWSLGEMPDAYTSFWMDLIQAGHIERFFTINSFMAPVVYGTSDRTGIGNWLFRIDEKWEIEYFETDPKVHQCPLIMDFPKGVAIIGRRTRLDSELSQLKKAAERRFQPVLQYDWVRSALSGCKLDDGTYDITKLSMSVAERTRSYIGHFRIGSGIDDTFFRIWDHYRHTGDKLPASLMVVYLSLAGRFGRGECSKEELILLKKLPKGHLHKHYSVFLNEKTQDTITAYGRILSIQSACDEAIRFLDSGSLDKAQELFFQVASANPQHADVWHYLSRIAMNKKDYAAASAYAAHVCFLYPVYRTYHESFFNAVELLKNKRPDMQGILSDRIPPTAFATHAYECHLRQTEKDMGYQEGFLLMILAGDGRLYFKSMAEKCRNENLHMQADAFEKAYVRYKIRQHKKTDPE